MGKRAYLAFILILVFILALAFYAPYLAFTNSDTAQGIYSSMSWACHQKISRSLCLFQGADGFYIDNCLPQDGRTYFGDNKIIRAINEAGDIGFKLVVCARDIGIYSGMLIVALVYPFYKKIEDDELPPPIYFVLALIPIGLDGGIQLGSFLGFYSYESMNITRIITGFVAGAAASFYLIPIFNRIERK